MKLDDIIIATAKKFLDTYGHNLNSDYGAWWLLRFRNEYAVANGITHARAPNRVTMRRYAEGSSPKSVKGIERLEAAGVSFPLTPAQKMFPELSNLTALVYFTGCMVETRAYGPTISLSGLIERETISHMLPSFLITFTSVNVSKAGESARPHYLLCPLGRVLYEMGIEPGPKLYHKADFPEYILNLARLIRNPEQGLLRQEDREKLKSICYSFAQIFFMSKGERMTRGLRIRLAARADKNTADVVTDQAKQFLSDLFNIMPASTPEERTTLANGEERAVYTPTIYIGERQLNWLVTEYGEAGSGAIDLSRLVHKKERAI